MPKCSACGEPWEPSLPHFCKGNPDTRGGQWQDHWPAFSEALQARLEQGAREYGDGSFDRSLVGLIHEIQEELLDVAGWGLVAWAKLSKLKEIIGGRGV